MTDDETMSNAAPWPPLVQMASARFLTRLRAVFEDEERQKRHGPRNRRAYLAWVRRHAPKRRRFDGPTRKQVACIAGRYLAARDGRVGR